MPAPSDGIRPKRNNGDGSQRERQRKQWREVIHEFVHAGGRGVFFEEEFQAIRQWLEQPVRTNAMRSPARLDVRDDFAFEPRQIGIHREHDEKQDCDFGNRDA